MTYQEGRPIPLVVFVLLVSWRQPARRVVLFCAGVGGLTLA
ncbi:hypothetical protein N9U66_02525 [Synechococcus sp. AH-736-M20]|nr:hypothetical protein [Synechococcus sp. AH-736-M20]